MLLEGKNAVVISSDGEAIDIAGTKAPLEPKQPTNTHTFHIFLDKSVIEVFADHGRTSAAKVVYPGENDLAIELFASGGKATVESLDIWQMKPIR